MREFFHGSRRKIGVMTLLMACALMGLWENPRVNHMPSFKIGITTTELQHSNHRQVTEYLRIGLSDHGLVGERCSEYMVNASEDSDDDVSYFVHLWSISYWSIVLPLTLLSAYLLLSKPRLKRKQLGELNWQHTASPASHTFE